ncbi:MAG TPA: hypothetical protein VFH27_12615 [Longimicrobiaceae bacterium]|nr:hypothetical protein [Longimicrobiaceae bacterium]
MQDHQKSTPAAPGAAAGTGNGGQRQWVEPRVEQLPRLNDLTLATGGGIPGGGDPGSGSTVF